MGTNNGEVAKPLEKAVTFFLWLYSQVLTVAEEFLKALSLQGEPEASSLFSLVKGIGLVAYVHFLLSSVMLKK